MSEQLPHDEELRALYRKLPADEPRAELDEAILAAARKAARHDDERRRFRRRVGWTVPLAAAAGVILTITLTRLTPEQPAIAPAALQEQAMRDAAAERETMSTKRAKVTRDEGRARQDAMRGNTAPKEEAATAPKTAAPVVPPAVADSIPAAPAPLAKKAPQPPPPAKGVPAPRAAAPEADRATAPESDAAMRGGGSRDAGAALFDDALSTGAPAAKPDETKESATRPLALGRARNAGEPEASVGAVARAEAWPFGLAPGLDAAEACRRVLAAMKAKCRFVGGVAVVTPDTPAVADAGEFAGRKIKHLTLTLRGDALWKLALRVEGYATDQVLVAPAPE